MPVFFLWVKMLQPKRRSGGDRIRARYSAGGAVTCRLGALRLDGSSPFPLIHIFDYVWWFVSNFNRILCWCFNIHHVLINISLADFKVYMENVWRGEWRHDITPCGLDFAWCLNWIKKPILNNCYLFATFEKVYPFKAAMGLIRVNSSLPQSSIRFVLYREQNTSRALTLYHVSFALAIGKRKCL